MALVYDDECFLCGRKDMTLIDGQFAPMRIGEEIPCKFCMECIKEMQVDQERFFEGLDMAQLIMKYIARQFDYEYQKDRNEPQPRE